MSGFKVTAQIEDVPTVEISDAVIAEWLRGRLNDARNYFIHQMERGSGSGRLYRRPGGRWHHASAPGEYPVTDGGYLVTRVDYQLNGPREGQLYSEVDYAEYLTTGNRSGTLQPRAMFADAITDVLQARPHSDQLARCVVVTSGPNE